MIAQLKEWLKKETVLIVAAVLAVVSCFFVPPDYAYFGYIDGATLALLFCLMLVMAGLQELGLFHFVGTQLLRRVKSQRSLGAVLVFLCFFSSMLVTNDVALITFVPLGILVLKMANSENLLCPVVILQTIAANLGSMLTPVGNPQNLYLYRCSGLGTVEFLRLMLPYTAVSAVLLVAALFMLLRPTGIKPVAVEATAPCKRLLLYCGVLFGLCLLAVAKILPVGALLCIVSASVLWKNKSLFAKVDYSLLLTFAAFFVFIGNIGRCPLFSSFISQILQGNEVITAVVASQVISNVPASLLLSGFSSQWKALIIGTNLGGLGTLIASMASLISYKQVAQYAPEQKGRYLVRFTFWNLLFLVVLLAVYSVLR